MAGTEWTVHGQKRDFLLPTYFHFCLNLITGRLKSSILGWKSMGVLCSKCFSSLREATNANLPKASVIKKKVSNASAIVWH